MANLEPLKAVLIPENKYSETEVDNYYAPGELINPLHQISYQYKGWSVDFDGLYKILSELNQNTATTLLTLVILHLWTTINSTTLL